MALCLNSFLAIFLCVQCLQAAFWTRFRVKTKNLFYKLLHSAPSHAVRRNSRKVANPSVAVRAHLLPPQLIHATQVPA
jgi:hypothetical protein